MKPLDEADVRRVVRLAAPAIELGRRLLPHWNSNYFRRRRAARQLARAFRRQLLAMPHKEEGQMPSFPEPYAVRQYGTDSSSRPVYMNARMWLMWQLVVERLGFEPVLVQGAYMTRVPGGGADASAGFHDRGSCLDTRTWDLTADQQGQVIRVARSIGWAVWKRDEAHGGFDEHMHWVAMGDGDAAWGALDQMAQYKAGLNGLSSRGPDYHWRPDPLVTDFDYFKTLKEIKVQTDDINAFTKKQADRLADLINTRAQGDAARDERILAAVDALPDTRLTRKDIREAIARALAAPTEETP